MNCSNCGEPIEVGAVFCGNCGQHLVDRVSAPTARGLAPEPIASSPLGPVGSAQIEQPVVLAPSKATVAIALGLAGLAGALLAPLIGLLAGGAALVIGTTAHRRQRQLSSLAIVCACLAISFGLVGWSLNIQKDQRLAPPETSYYFLRTVW